MCKCKWIYTFVYMAIDTCTHNIGKNLVSYFSHDTCQVSLEKNEKNGEFWKMECMLR
jgi:hypothetical protein